MQAFLGPQYLLGNGTAAQLYERYAKDKPIFDYHNHLSAQELFEDKSFRSITELWLAHDHYKWRAMRAAGVDEALITGNAGDREKFIAFASVVERLVGSPVYYWVHMELWQYFGITQPLCSQTAAEIYERCNEMLSTPGFTARALVERAGVTHMCTTDDPLDDLCWHRRISEAQLPFKVLPSFRPDRAILLEADSFPAYIAALKGAYKVTAKGIAGVCEALSKALDFFVENGCVITDHGLKKISFVAADEATVDAVLQKRLKGEPLTSQEVDAYQSYLLLFLGEAYKARNLVFQLHLGALRNANGKMFAQLGPDSGYDSVGSAQRPEEVSALLDALALRDALPKTILYTINPHDYAPLSTLSVSFCKAGVPGYVHFGNSWWFNDTVRGISRQLDELFETGQLSGFVGMLTDSRSLTSFSRHDFFRRILCTRIGEFVERGEYPLDEAVLGRLIGDICYDNALRYFGFAE